MFADEDTNSPPIIIIFSIIPILFIALIFPFKMCLRKQKKKGKMGRCGKWCYNFCILRGENKDQFENRFRDIPYDIINMGKKDYMYFNPITRPKALLECFEKEIEEGKYSR